MQFKLVSRTVFFFFYPKVVPLRLYTMFKANAGDMIYIVTLENVRLVEIDRQWSRQYFAAVNHKGIKKNF